MNFWGVGAVLMFSLCHMADNTSARPPDFVEIDDLHSRLDGILAPDPAGLNQRRGLPWANGKFVYEFGPEVQQDPQKTGTFENACRQLLANTALNCVNRSQAGALGERDYVYVIEGASNHSFVGRQGGKQLLGILNWNNQYKISHEIKHALGWGHEHQQPKRDQYIDILFENIPDDKKKYFYINDNNNEGEYDFDSVMHYYPTDYAIPAQKSIRAKSEFQSREGMMGQRDHLSAIDLLEIQEFYGNPTVEWCGVSRKPDFRLPSGCFHVCHLDADPTIGNWVLAGACDSTNGTLSLVN